MSNHKKHADIARPSLGEFGRNEWAILGTDCGSIKKLAFQLTKALSTKWKVAYVDADHKEAEAGPNEQDAASARSHGAVFEYTDKISCHRFDLQGEMGKLQYRPLFNQMDLVLVNGNHFSAQRQIVVVDPKKEDSLKRKLARLTQVDWILLKDGVSELPLFLKDHLRASALPIIASLNQVLNEPSPLVAYLDQQLSAAVPPLNGLVLAGGKSLRMGTDKGQLNYHGTPQRDRLIDLLEVFCETTYLSCRPEQAGELAYEFDVMPDTFLGLGPMGAILTAFRSQPDRAWLVVACDLPLLDHDTLEFLIQHRNPAALATTFRSPVNQFPEPLVTIWEPKSYQVLLDFLGQGYSCPRKALINSPVHILEAPNPLALKNVNTREEYEEILAVLAKR